MEILPIVQHSHDVLYGKLTHTPDDLKLFQTKELTRLRQLSLSAVPPWTIPTGNCATKFEHSVGVGYLAKIVGNREEFRDFEKDLYFASLGHDIATPPFSHLSESFLVKKFGVDHEQLIDDVLDGSEYAQEVKRQGGSVDRVIKYIKGEDKPISDMINGSIDLDNLDNSLRYGLSMGLVREHLYSPAKLAQAFSVKDGSIFLEPENMDDIIMWEKCRDLVYDFVYSPTNFSAGSMVWRAIYFAFQSGEISKDYFSLTDTQAQSYLEEHCNPRTSV